MNEENIMKAKELLDKKNDVNEIIREEYVKQGIEAYYDLKGLKGKLYGLKDELFITSNEIEELENEFLRVVLEKRLRPIKHLKDEIRKDGKILP